MSAEEDVNGFAWWFGWHPGPTIIGVMVFVSVIGFMAVDGAGQIIGVAVLGLIVGFVVHFWGTREVNANYKDLLIEFESKAERTAARGIEVSGAETHSLTWGSGKSPMLVNAFPTYRTSTLVVTGTSVNINEGAKFDMVGREGAGGGTNRELFYDQITAVDSHQDGMFSKLKINTSGGESIDVGSGATETVDAAISAVRKKLREVKSGKNMSMGQQQSQQQSQSNANSGEASTATQSGASAKSGSSTDTESASDDSETDSNRGRSQSAQPESLTDCPACGERIDADAKFCPECGADLTEPNESRGTRPSNTGNGRTAGEQATATGAGTGATGEQPDHPVVDVAGSLLNTKHLESETARRFLERLADPSADETDVTRVVESTIETVESTEAVADTLNEGNFSTERQVKSTRRSLQSADGELARALDPLLTELEDTAEDVSDLQNTQRTHRSALEGIVEAAERSDVVNFRSNDLTDRASTVVTSLQNGDVTFADPSPSFESDVQEVKRAVSPQSTLSQELLTVLEDPDGSDPVGTLQSIVDRLDEYDDIDTMVSDIEARDVRRRIQSLDEELRTRSGDVYDHLADRIRELESMIEGADTLHAVQLYAIYQECTFYDRTLLPRLERSQASRSAGKVSDMLDEVEQRIRYVQDEYITVRADHNHSIPKHFLSLSEDLLTEAERQTSAEPDRAAGTLLAAEALVDHVEELYVRNEYSVMLRRLRG